MKLAGACFIMTGCLGLAGSRIKRDRKRREALLELQKLFTMLYSEIKFRSMTFMEAFSYIGERMDKTMAQFLNYLSTEWKKKTGKSVCEIWNDGIRQHLFDSGLKNGDILVLKGLGECMGSFDKAEQIGHIEYLLLYLETEAASSEKTVKESEKLYKTLGILAGVFMIIVLI